MTKGRYLTSKEKRTILHYDFKEGVYKENGAYGKLDNGMEVWLRRINALPGMVTVASCGGHRNKGLITDAFIWLRADQLIMRQIDYHAFELSNKDFIKKTSFVFKEESDDERDANYSGKKLFVVEFEGNEKGMFDESMNAIFGFLVFVAATVYPPDPHDSFEWPSLYIQEY